MLPCLLFLTFGMVAGETCDGVFQDSIQDEDSVKECVTSLMKDFQDKFESIRKADDKLIKSMQTEIENLKNDNLVYRKDIDQLKSAYQKQMQRQQLRTDSTKSAAILDSLKKDLDNATQENGYMKVQMDVLAKAAHFKPMRPERSSQFMPRTYHTPVRDRHEDLSPSRHAAKRLARLSFNNSAISHVAFHAILGHQVTDPGNDHELSFENVITNIGNSYSRNTGAFTAYQPGTYVFSWEITATATTYMDTHLLKNGDVVGTIRSWGYSGSGSTSSGTAILDLDSRDEVWVRVGDHTSGADVLAKYSMFSGFRVY